MLVIRSKQVEKGQDATECWEATVVKISQLPGAPQQTDQTAWGLLRYIFDLWVGASAPLNKKAFSGSKDQPLIYTQVKSFNNITELALALFNNYKAQNSVLIEENLAINVLSNICKYEQEILDPLMERIFGFIQTVNNPQLLAESISSSDFYGELPKVRWDSGDWGVISTDLNQGAGIERMFRKVANIHLLGRVGRKFDLPVETNHRTRLGETRDRHNPYQPLEEAEQIQRLRQGNAPVWAGLSGSSGDILAVAQALGITDPYKLNCLAWVTFAFFHFMPTSFSPTHTFHEVMMGAKMASDAVDYDTITVRYPRADFVSTTQKPLDHPDHPITQALMNPPPNVGQDPQRLKYYQALSRMERK